MKVMAKLCGERKFIKKHVRPLTFSEYMNDDIHPLLVIDNAGLYRECRWNGKPKTWKTRPTHVKRPMKYGMYECFYGGLKTLDTLMVYTLREEPTNAE